MVYATDLDRTIIYSRSFVTKENMQYLAMFPDGNAVNFMTKKAYDLLKKIKEKIYVIPCTTRSLEQFTRLLQFRDCEYAICDNGATILHNGKINKQWEFVVNKNMEFCTRDLLVLQDNIQKQDFLGNTIRFIDKYFLFFKTNDTTKCRDWLESVVDKKKFYYTISGKKCYIFPKFMTKDTALRYLLDTIGETDLITSGDSQVDFGMLDMATKGAYLPLNDYFEFDFNFNFAKNITILSNMGISAGEYILSKVSEIIDKESETND